MSKRIPRINNKKQLVAATVLFAVFELAVVHLMYNVKFSLFSYVCIISSCMFCAVVSDGSRSWLFTQLGLLGTVGADFFLVFLPVQRRVPGLIFFCMAQAAYFLRIYFEDQNRTRRKIHLAVRGAASVAALIITPVVLGPRLDAVALISVFYYANLICNVIFAFINFRQSGVFALALLAFILSDTLLGFQSLSSYFLIPRGSFIFYAVQIGKRIFYPLYILSQVTIPLSVAFRNKRKTENF